MRNNSAYDFVAIAYRPSGALKWRRYFTTGNYDFAKNVSIGRNNSVFVAGSSDASSFATIIKFSGGGIRR